jgi:hypothetical protein
MASSVGLDVSFDNLQDWKGVQEKAGEVNSKKAYVTNDEFSAGGALVCVCVCVCVCVRETAESHLKLRQIQLLEQYLFMENKR